MKKLIILSLISLGFGVHDALASEKIAQKTLPEKYKKIAKEAVKEALFDSCGGLMDKDGNIEWPKNMDYLSKYNNCKFLSDSYSEIATEKIAEILTKNNQLNDITIKQELKILLATKKPVELFLLGTDKYNPSTEKYEPSQRDPSTVTLITGGVISIELLINKVSKNQR